MRQIAGIMGIIINEKKNTDVKLRFAGFKPDGKVIGQIYKVGVPSIIMQAIGSVMKNVFPVDCSSRSKINWVYIPKEQQHMIVRYCFPYAIICTSSVWLK